MIRGVAQWLRRELRYAGWRYRCPLCFRGLRALAPLGVSAPVLDALDVVGAGPRAGRCPGCGSAERTRLLGAWLRAHPERLAAGARLLHIAPERGLARRLRARDGLEYFSGDLEPGRAMARLDLRAIDWPDASFDAVIASHVLEHVLEDRVAMAEVMRVLRPGGWANLQVPFTRRRTASVEDLGATTDADRLAAFGQTDHVRIYALDDYVDRLRGAGFRVELVRWWEHPGAFGGAANRYALDPREPLMIANKPA